MAPVGAGAPIAAAVSGSHPPSTAPVRRLIGSITLPLRAARYNERITTTSAASV
jgi:hypothetical protein